MDTRKIVLIGTGILLAVILNLGSSEENDIAKPPLKESSAEELWRTKASIVEARNAHIESAVSALEDGQGGLRPGDPRLTAIEVLGILRAKEGVAPLVSIIDLRLGTVVSLGDKAPDIGDHYPATKALVEIGKPASSACLDALENCDGGRKRSLLMWVMREVEGEDVVQLLLEKRLEDRQGKAGVNLQSALELVDQEL